MTDAVLAAIVTGGISLAGVIITSLISHNSYRTLSQYQIREIKEDIAALSKRVDKHNNLVERMASAEQAIRSAHRRIDEMKEV